MTALICLNLHVNFGCTFRRWSRVVQFLYWRNKTNMWSKILCTKTTTQDF